MKKRTLAMTFVVAIVLSFISPLHVPAFAAAHTIRTTQLDLRDAASTKNDAEGWSWDKETKTLVLDNVYFDVDTTSALLMSSATIVLKGKNTITANYLSNAGTGIFTNSVSGITSWGNLVFEGDGELITSGCPSGKSRSSGSGILCLSSSIIVNGGTILATGDGTGGTGASGEGIHARNLTINGGSVVAKGGLANQSYRCYGVYVDEGGTIKITGGSLNASCGSGTYQSPTGIDAAVYSFAGHIEIDEDLTVVTPKDWKIHEFAGRLPQIAISDSSDTPAKEVVIEGSSEDKNSSNNTTPPQDSSGGQPSSPTGMGELHQITIIPQDLLMVDKEVNPLKKIVP